MAFYFNYFHFYTILWNKCGPAYIFLQNVIIWRLVKFKTIISSSQDPKKLNSFNFIG